MNELATYDAKVEALCRTICKAEGVNPDQESVGFGALMAQGQKYKLWEARKRVAIALINDYPELWEDVG